MTYPEVQVYINARESARDVYDKALKKNDDKKRKGELSHSAFWTEEGELNRARYEAINAAWDVLKGSEHPLVVFIANNCLTYKNEALTVLEALPLTYEGLEELAAKQDWCGAWNRLLYEAIVAGVITDAPRLSQERVNLIEWFSNEYDTDRDEITKLNELISAVVAAEAAGTDA